MSSFLDDLLNETPLGAREVVRAKLRVAVSEAILLALEGANATKADLASRTCVSRAAVTQALSGHRNLSLNTLADMAQALDLEAHVTLCPLADSEFKRLVRGSAKGLDAPVSNYRTTDLAEGRHVAMFSPSFKGTSSAKYIAISKDGHVTST